MDPKILLSVSEFARKHSRCNRRDYLARVGREARKRAESAQVLTRSVTSGRSVYTEYPEDFLYRVFMDVHA